MTLDLQPSLNGDLIRLRPLQPSDIHELYGVASDPRIWRQHPARDRHQEEVFKVFFREALDSAGALIALDAKTDRVIGCSRFHAYDAARGEVEIGWTFLARSHWGGRYNGEMKRLMLEHAFRRVRRVIFVIGTENTRSQKAIERIGAARIGSRPEPAGRESYVYQITAGGWMERKRSMSAAPSGHPDSPSAFEDSPQ